MRDSQQVPVYTYTYIYTYTSTHKNNVVNFDSNKQTNKKANV